ncbi:putative aminoglycoside phosphotransferase [Cupriavidus sp. TA19]|uniref:phosphotransferase family protein n=1 Tax=unclassified Cupriavidus TaxID=2640874 RepID=UPI000E2E8511|nr:MULTISPECIES: aminoglycoside phosphotransferase family protein [unclassified Cupriavidus]BDB29606.1 aminoglycoside phosphotransferase family protein [Cupriavidus sp. P-10]GLC95475.1 putative aminoglycoside phosphotransferase [Cupriavidus sp. TA19]
MTISETFSSFDVEQTLLVSFLTSHGLMSAAEEASFSRLTGGVSSDIWKVDLPGRTFAVKRALGKLKVAADWEAPLTRNAYEWAWLQFASEHVPDNVPRPIARDAEAGLFAMSFLPPRMYPVWKAQLMAGHIEWSVANEVGRVLAKLHAASAAKPDLAAKFDSAENFHALRLEPYLLATAARNPHVADVLVQLAQRTRDTRLALVHGDVSPKNILVGPKGPVFLDAECAWYGDPAFDLAFCLNHLLLKCIVQPDSRDALIKCFESLATEYLQQVSWEPADGLEARAASLLPALLLARVDGKSPVEYLSQEKHKELVRSVAFGFLRQPVSRLMEVADGWRVALARGC